MEMSRTYKVLRGNADLQGIKKEWVLYNKRGAKKFQQIVNKRCRRLDKTAIAEGINDIADDVQESIREMIEDDSWSHVEEDWGWEWDKDEADEDWAFEDDLEDDYFDSEEDLYDPYWVDPLDWY